MSIDTVTAEADVLADVEAIVAAITSRTPIDPDVIKRIQARSQTIRNRVLQEHGPLNIAVPAILELRDG